MGEEVDPQQAAAFLKWWAEETEAKRDPGAQIRRKDSLDEFRAKFKAIRTTLMKCPTDCGGTLWSTHKGTNWMVCHRCETEFILECQTMPNDALTLVIREARKALENL